MERLLGGSLNLSTVTDRPEVGNHVRDVARGCAAARSGLESGLAAHLPHRSDGPRGGLDGPAERRDEQSVLAGGVRREEARDLGVVEREAGGAEALGIGPEVEPAADE